MRLDVVDIDDATDQRLENALRPLPGQQIETTVLQVAKARREAKAKEVAHAEDVVGCTARIGIVLLDIEAGLMVEQTVEDVRRLARGGRDHLGVEGIELVGHMRVESYPRLIAVAGIDGAESGAVTASAEILPIGG